MTDSCADTVYGYKTKCVCVCAGGEVDPLFFIQLVNWPVLSHNV